ncbi:MAG: hypothetical protein K6G19_02985 [Lachnospiraceae bacterium]|nr:hypothetical protein [Lachnospiraceae bacterium]
MNEKYRPYNYSKPMLLIYGLGYPLVLLLLLFLGPKMVTADVKSLILPIMLLPISIIIVGIAPRYVRCSFTADKNSVTFKQPLSKDISISYRDIEKITVSHKKVRTQSARGGGRSFYAETIVIETQYTEYTFQNEMDIKVNSRMEAWGRMDKMFEMGQFALLKKYIEIQQEKMQS